MNAEQRRKLTEQVADDKDLSPTEQMVFLWNVLWLEVGFWQRARAKKRIEKYGTRCNITIAILNARKEMADL